MKILIDENLPKKLKQDLSLHSVFTVWDKEWQSKKNGDLIKYPIAVLVINTYNNQYDTIQKFINILKVSIDKSQSPWVYILLE